MGHQQKKRPMLEPVLENYMGPPISYATPRKPSHGSSTAKVAPSSGAELGQQQFSKAAKSLNPLNIFGKLRDRYIKAMNEMAMGGDYAAVVGYHGCVAGPEYPVEHRRSELEREREIEALREELAALRRKHDHVVSVDEQ